MTYFEVIIVPSFQKEIEKIKERKQLELIYKSIEKIERMGNQLMKKLEYAFEGGIKNIMELFSH